MEKLFAILCMITHMFSANLLWIFITKASQLMTFINTEQVVGDLSMLHWS